MVIHRDKIRWLFWLRWKLFLRSFSRDRGRIISTIFLIVFGLPFFAGIAVGTFFAYRYLPPPANVEILFLVLTGVYLVWLTLPLLEFTVNEGLDVSKLTLFPLTRPELMVSLLFSTLLDIPMLGLILVFIAVVVGWAISVPVALLTILAMLIFYVQVVGMSQLVLALLMRTLQSRRFRDLTIILLALFSASCYLFQQVALRAIGNRDIVANLQNANFSLYLQWLPPGMTARAISQAVLGDWGASSVWLGASLVASILVLYLWQLVLERSLSTPEVGGATRTRRHRAMPGVGAVSLPSSSQATSVSVWQRILPTQTLAITLKECKYFWRDPQLKALLFQSLIYIIVFIIVPLFNSTGSGVSWGVLTFTVPLSIFFSVFVLSYNSLGMERQSLTTLFLFPINPKRILWGKNLPVAIIGIVELLVLIPGIAFLSQNWNFVLPVLAVGLAGIGVVLGCGNFSSVFLPQRMRLMQRGVQATGSSPGSSGFLRALLSIGMMLVTAIVLVPVVLALFLPSFWNMQWLWFVSIPASLVYGILFYQVVTRLVAARMLRRVPEILAVTTRE